MAKSSAQALMATRVVCYSFSHPLTPLYHTTWILFLLSCLRSFHYLLTLRTDGPFSTGRGGSANIGAKGSPVITTADKDVIPAQATRVEKMESHHYGRGGAGNGTSKSGLVGTPSLTLFLLQGNSGWKKRLS